nr:bifunctional [glutamine synthetase] adenylyltransferase/[glutamine synthetase]-adenylyl-L-tyrosine phosphorylase [Aureimonas fodinaquatilis]
MASKSMLIGGNVSLQALDPVRAESWLADLSAAAEQADCHRLVGFLAGTSADRSNLGAILDLSPYLNGLMLGHPEWVDALFDQTAQKQIAALVAALNEPVPDRASEGEEMTFVRRSKNQVSLLIALLDLFGVEDEAYVTGWLSELAEAVVRRVVRFCLNDLQRRGQLQLPDMANPEKGSGLFVLGMGKLGGRELNYSSDIDLIILFDPEVPAIVDPTECVEMFSRLARRLVRMVGERTRDGYGFRTDLRLRPDPSAMPLAIPLPTALVYYESAGRDWERAAMIKARVVAGDEAAAAEFLSAITPFVYRRYLDFAAIRDIQAMKGRIDRHRGFEGLGVGGHNVKLGRGGIREIEFFAQTQQLIAGGRAPELRLLQTIPTLHALAQGGWISKDTASELTECYWFLRHVEHVIQMVADEQTHTLPETQEDLLRVARLAGYGSVLEFSKALLQRLAIVDKRFGQLFAGRDRKEVSPVLAVLSDETDERAQEWLAEAGYKRVSDVAHIIHGWGTGRYRAMRSEAAREQLTRMLPQLLEAFSSARDPDSALAMFDRFLQGLPAGLQFFALIASNPRLLDLLALILTTAPNLTETISRRPHVFDALIDPSFFGEMPSRDLINERLSAFLQDSPGHEDRLDRLRIFASEQKFLTGVRLLSGAIEGEEAGEAFSDLADEVITALLETVENEFASRHGRVLGGRLGLQGLGRLGSRELTATSDVDLILFYDHDADAEESDGERPLPVSTYYARLTQRLIAALSSPMAEGILYEVDFRLRPSGNKGPLATHVDAFARYQEQEAWTWERMSLTRSRPIAGDKVLLEKVGNIIRHTIAAHKADDKLVGDVASMRRRIGKDKPPRGPLDLKLLPGGLIDLEFIAQWALLAGVVPADFVGKPTVEVLAALEATDHHPAVSGLSTSMQMFSRIAQLRRLGPDNARATDDLPRGLAERIARSIDAPDISQIEAMVADSAAEVRAVFNALLPMPDDVDLPGK